MLTLFDPSSIRRGACVGLTLVLCLACGDEVGSPEARRPVLVVGVDGLEWSVLVPLLAQGELPTIARWIEFGEAGLLKSMRPTKSPVIWTTIATGMTPRTHGILDFVRQGESGTPSLFTRLDRKVPALWNMASEAGRDSAVIGWWMTHPVEPIRGVMMAQTNTLPGEPGPGGGVWKGAPDLDRPDQVHPSELRPLLAEVLTDVDGGLDARLTEIFGELDFADEPLVERMWGASRWSVRADAIYVETLNRLLDGPSASFDLAMLYLGGADVLGHRFWRYHQPGDFEHPPSSWEVERFGSVLTNYYRFLDSIFAGIDARAAGRWNILVVSDHGMRAHHADSNFEEEQQLGKLTSGHHFQAPAGVVLATGPDFRRGALSADWANVSIDDLRTLGGVYDVTPTVLTLMGLPTASDMHGRPMERLFSREFLAAERASEIATYGAEGMELGPGGAETIAGDEAEEAERLEQLRDLGYIE